MICSLVMWFTYRYIVFCKHYNKFCIPEIRCMEPVQTNDHISLANELPLMLSSIGIHVACRVK
jgi:hypothetical protein